jgi:hypothetical protein
VVSFATAADRVLKMAVQPANPIKLREEIQRQLLGTNFAGVRHTRRSPLITPHSPLIVRAQPAAAVLRV